MAIDTLTDWLTDLRVSAETFDDKEKEAFTDCTEDLLAVLESYPERPALLAFVLFTFTTMNERGLLDEDGEAFNEFLE